MGRAPCCEKIGLKKGRWTSEEDEILTKYIQANGEGSWRSLPKNAGLLRCGKSCRLRWINYLRSDLKRGNITTEEEELIVKLHNSMGNRWSLIASHLPGRTDNEIKNYWNSHLRRKIYCFTKLSKEPHLTIVNSVRIGAPRKRKAGRVSRSAMKKNKLNIPTTNKKMDTSEEGTQMESPRETSLESKTITANNSAGIIEENQREEGNDNSKNTDVYDFCMQSEDAGNNNGAAFSPCKYREETDVLGPYEWLDNEIKRLSSIFKDEGETCGSNGHNEQRECRSTVSDINEDIGRNGCMGTVAEDATLNGGREINFCSSDAENKECVTCSPSVNLSFDDKWIDWGWTDDVQICQLDLGKGDENMLSWL